MPTKKIKPVKAWAVVIDGKPSFNTDTIPYPISIYKFKSEAKEMASLSAYYCDVVRVLISPITKRRKE